MQQCLCTILLYIQVGAVQESLEHDMELLCLTGVEDKLQVNSFAGGSLQES